MSLFHSLSFEEELFPLWTAQKKSVCICIIAWHTYSLKLPYCNQGFHSHSVCFIETVLMILGKKYLKISSTLHVNKI